MNFCFSSETIVTTRITIPPPTITTVYSTKLITSSFRLENIKASLFGTRGISPFYVFFLLWKWIGSCEIRVWFLRNSKEDLYNLYRNFCTHVLVLDLNVNWTLFVPKSYTCDRAPRWWRTLSTDRSRETQCRSKGSSWLEEINRPHTDSIWLCINKQDILCHLSGHACTMSPPRSL